MMKKFLLLLCIFSLTGCTQTVNLSAVSDITATALASKYALATEIKSKYQLEGVALKKTDIKNAELDKYKGEPKDEVQVIIGDEVLAGNLGATTEFKPNIEFKRWNEVGFKLKTDKLLADVASKDKKLSFDKDKIKFDTPKISFEMYDYAEGEGGYKYIWYLNEKPATNKIEFEIESEGLDFFYQPPLTEEFQNGYSEKFQKEIVVTEIQVKDLEGNILVERPENVVGSYAVYHSTKGGMVDAYGKDYKTGKALHIYRPHIIDAVGRETWGILHIGNGIYSVEIPQEFLDKASFPIKSNDTFGDTSTSATYDGTSPFDDKFQGILVTAPANIGAVSKFTIYGKSAFHSNFKGIIVLNSTLAIIANGITNAVDFGSSAAWRDLTFATPPTPVASTIYILGGISDTSAEAMYDSGSSGDSWVDTSNNYTTPTNPTDGSAGAKLFSIYATYTASAPASTYCGHTRGDWYINTDCTISTSTTTQGTIYIGNGGSLNCVDNAVIEAKAIQATRGQRVFAKRGCIFKLRNY